MRKILSQRTRSRTVLSRRDEKENTGERHPCLFIALLILLAWLPLPLGSNRPWAWAVMELGTLIIFFSWLISYISRPYQLPLAVYKAKIPLALLVAWLAYLLLQAVPLPGVFVETFSASTYQLRVFTLGEADAVQHYISLDPQLTQVMLLKSLAYTLLFFLVLCLVDTGARLKIIIQLLFFVGFAQAVFAIFIHTLPSGWLWDPSPGSVSGSYVNRNHFAGLMELTIPLGLAMIMYKTKPATYYPTWKAKGRELVAFLLSKRSHTMVFVVIMFGALFLSTSRGGSISLLSALVLVLLLAFATRRFTQHESRFSRWLVILIVIAATWLGAGGLADRLENTTLDNNRVAIWESSVKIIKDYPVFGAGAGNFQRITPLYRGVEIGSLYNRHAHNDYLELLSEVGLVGALLSGSFILWSLVNISKAYLYRRHLYMRAMLFAVLVGSLSLLLHGLVDFNFQIPANAALFFVLLALGVVLSVLERKDNQQNTESSGRRQKCTYVKELW